MRISSGVEGDVFEKNPFHGEVGMFSGTTH